MENDSEIGIASPSYGINELPKYSPIKGPYMISIPKRGKGCIESVDFAHATLSIFRKECIRKIGLFDERYFAYGDEYDISLRARKQGWKTSIVWDATVTNPGTGTPKPIISYLLARNTLLLALEHGSWVQAIIRAFLMAINTLVILLIPAKQGFTFHSTARIKGIKDFLTKCYGMPRL